MIIFLSPFEPLKCVRCVIITLPLFLFYQSPAIFASEESSLCQTAEWKSGIFHFWHSEIWDSVLTWGLMLCQVNYINITVSESLAPLMRNRQLCVCVRERDTLWLYLHLLNVLVCVCAHMCVCDWTGTSVWSLSLFSLTFTSHHDAEPRQRRGCRGTKGLIGSGTGSLRSIGTQPWQ